MIDKTESEKNKIDGTQLGQTELIKKATTTTTTTTNETEQEQSDMTERELTKQ